LSIQKSIIMSNHLAGTNENETQIRQLIENWAAAVRNRDIEAILDRHADDIVMYDVPEPFQSVGIAAYRKTWDLFFACTKPDVFDIRELHIVADKNVAFCFASMKCADKSKTADYVDLDFRLTVGLKKVNDQWTIVHEHHSVPSE
jgi:ketosteroid isomerase-like protein